MTNEEAIRILKPLFEECKGQGGCLGYIEHFVTRKEEEAMKLAIKALEQTSWIPVSERLPEEYNHVLCQFCMGGMAECYYAHNFFHVVGGLRVNSDEVIAWQPLPQPYKAESEDEE